MEIPIGQTVQNTLNPSKGAAAKEPIRMPFARAPLFIALEIGHALQRRLLLLSRSCMFLPKASALEGA